MTFSLKFSHNYEKLPKDWRGQQAKLLDVVPVKLENLPPALIEFDTRITKTQQEIDLDLRNQHYELPKKGDFLFLLLQMETGRSAGALFFTLRRDTPEKRAYYIDQVTRLGVLVSTEETKE